MIVGLRISKGLNSRLNITSYFDQSNF